ncbi:MAG: DUF4339 domain-containing protein [Polyangiaceae bacterium]|nr:DUF4339 domain-containing protein [Polyangiaceae bacterium]
MRTVDCHACGARFALSDDLFAGEVVGRQRRVHCWQCGAAVVVGGTDQDDQAPPWIVDVGEDQDRRFGEDQLRQAIATGTVTGEMLAWREGMAAWLPLASIAAFREVLETGRHANDQDESTAAAPDPGSAIDVLAEAPEDRVEGTAGTASELSEGLPGDPGDRSHEVAPRLEDGLRDLEGLAAGVQGESGSDAGVEAAQVVPPRETEGPVPAPAEIPAERQPTEATLPNGEVGETGGAESPGRRRPLPSPPDIGKRLHALFSVDSVPPMVALQDSEVLSLPPSVAPPKAPILGRLPRAARVPRIDGAGPPLLDPPPACPPLAPPESTALLAPPAEPDQGSLDIEVAVDDSAPTPARIETLVSATAESSEAAATEVALRSRKRALRWMVPGLAALGVIALGGLLLVRPTVPPAGEGANASSQPEPSAAVRVTPPPSTRQEPEAPEPKQGQTASPVKVERRTPEPVARSTAASTPSVRSVTGSESTATSPTPTEDTAPKRDRTAKPAATTTAEAAAEEAPFDRAAAAAALTAAAASASSCRRGTDPSGMAVVMVTFAPSGRVTSANVSGPPFAGTATGGCIAAVIRQATVPPFSGGHRTVTKRIVIQ